MEIGKKLKTLIKNKGLSQRQFAEEIDENLTQLNKVLNGERAPSYEMLEKSLVYFKDVDLNWLLKAQYDPEDPIPLVAENNLSYGNDVIKDIYQLSEIIARLKLKVSQ